ncbi:GvpL/GvpF family gas vesicle protein [Streptomyces hesseae]|uniref:GvpL/GvpF family gas vesicle protein n=1 Tax=Streptomyces hesseae TaxID=3075519 RepID=A0ABU2SQ56_9ACTN|nr:GvpL/GvpF family gas vesicle protein [Streptomyces sp. DSM 40473]MDT0451136.1 GvpL/GvpF family gas vesicle protein [Streptomyces sp. DSM 40473]
MSTYVYGITDGERTRLPEGLTGIGEPPRPVRLVTDSGLAAVVSDCPEGLRPKRRDLLAHQQVLSEAGRKSAVLPMRFGSVCDSDDDVVQVLSRYAERYRSTLERLSGRVEYNVKAVHHEETVLHVVLAENAELRALAEANRRAGGGTYEDRLRFGEMVAEAVRSREAWDADLVRDTLEPLAEGCRTGPESGGWFLSLSFLVAEPAAEVLLTTVERLCRAHPQLDLKVTGPLPPYSFVDFVDS